MGTHKYIEQIKAAELDLGRALTHGECVDLLLDNNADLRSSSEAQRIVDQIARVVHHIRRWSEIQAREWAEQNASLPPTHTTMDARNVIALSRDKNCWLATYSGPHAKDIIRSFGISALPTTFTPQADAQTVLDEIQRLNPGCKVVLA